MLRHARRPPRTLTSYPPHKNAISRQNDKTVNFFPGGGRQETSHLSEGPEALPRRFHKGRGFAGAWETGPPSRLFEMRGESEANRKVTEKP
uniref:Uncharacterized protein n=1 Tax=Leptospirillum ferrodiazotrophum TaxID=412449 RepID=C6HXQ1_9BACT|nr:MAG: hypothetical protein UBAL3_93200010 [Leptospirillum ferrodiazotrophum]